MKRIFTSKYPIQSLNNSLKEVWLNWVEKFKETLSFMAQSFIVLYQGTISIFLGGNCRFYPSCSHYSKQCFEDHSFLFASKLTVRRILKCHPFGSSGYDPVPEKQEESDS